MASDDRMFIKPLRGLVRHPYTGSIIPPEGADVTSASFYFHRLILTGDVARIPAPTPGVVTRAKKE